MKATAIYFSPTDTNRKSVCAIAKVLGGEYKELDVTCKAGKAQFGPEDVVVFGAPVYGGRIFKGIAERLHDVRGENTPCVVTVTYGNRDFDDALLELCDMVSAQGFVPIAAGAMIGQHTYGSIQVGRPNDSDLAEDTAFAENVLEKLKNGDYSTPEIPGKRPYGDGGNGGSFFPLTSGACVNCGRCARECPMQAIAADNRTIDTSRCIACFRCVRRCPVGAKNMDTPEYNDFAAAFTERLKETRDNAYFI